MPQVPVILEQMILLTDILPQKKNNMDIINHR